VKKEGSRKKDPVSSAQARLVIGETETIEGITETFVRTHAKGARNGLLFRASAVKKGGLAAK